MPEESDASCASAGTETCSPPPPSARYLSSASAARLKWACFRWAGPASPNLRPGTWRTWTLCSASSSTGQCPVGGLRESPPRVPGDSGEGRGNSVLGSRGKSLAWDSPGTALAAGGALGPARPPSPQSGAREPQGLASGSPAPRGTGLVTLLQKHRFLKKRNTIKQSWSFDTSRLSSAKRFVWTLGVTGVRTSQFLTNLNSTPPLPTHTRAHPHI